MKPEDRAYYEMLLKDFEKMHPDQKQIVVTPEMVDDMKTTVAAFFFVQMLLSWVAVAWLMIARVEWFWLSYPAAVAAYSAFAFWFCATAWIKFKTRIAVLN